MSETSKHVAYLAADEAMARTVAEALEAEGIACALEPARGYHGLEEGRVEIRVSGELASRARALALEVVGR